MSVSRALASFFVAAIPVAVTSIPTTEDATRIDWLTVERRILPSSEELGFRDIGWRTVFWDALKEAQRERKPILLWAMNGHPLGCT